MTKERSYLSSALELAALQGLAILTSFPVKYKQTQLLTLEQFGTFSLWVTLITCLSIVARFGVFSSSQYCLIHAKNEQEERELKGTTLLVISALLAFSTILSFTLGSVLSLYPKYTEVSTILIQTAPITGCILLPYLIQVFSIGTGNLRAFGMVRFFSQLLFLLFLFSTSISLTVEIAWYYLLAMGSASLSILFFSKLSFQNIRQNLSRLIEATKTHGIYLYFGQLTDQISLHLDTLCIAYFVSIEEVGYYALASSIFIPLTLLNTSLCQALLKKISHSNVLEKSTIFTQRSLLISFSLLTFFGSNILIPVIFGESYVPACLFTFPMLVRSLVKGLYEPYSFFLFGKGKGRWCKNVSLFMCIMNVICFITFTWAFGGLGAAWASVCGRLAYLIGIAYYYSKWKQQNGISHELLHS